MGLLEEARAEVYRPGPQECSLVIALAKHKKLAKEIEAVIRDRTVSNAGAERVFDRHGIDVSQNTISRHRNNQCKSCKARGVVW